MKWSNNVTRSAERMWHLHTVAVSLVASAHMCWLDMHVSHAYVICTDDDGSPL